MRYLWYCLNQMIENKLNYPSQKTRARIMSIILFDETVRFPSHHQSVDKLYR